MITEEDMNKKTMSILKSLSEYTFQDSLNIIISSLMSMIKLGYDNDILKPENQDVFFDALNKQLSEFSKVKIIHDKTKIIRLEVPERKESIKRIK